MAASPWWVISASTLNGQPWQAVALQFPDRAAAQAASQGGVLGGPFTTEAAAASFGNAWSKRTKRKFTDNPGVSSGNPVTGAGAGAGEVAGSAASSLGGIAGGIAAFYDVLTDGKLWRSLGWIMLGIALMFTGIGLWIGPAAARSSPAGVAAGFARRAYG